MSKNRFFFITIRLLALPLLLSACKPDDPAPTSDFTGAPVLLVIDEESIDNGNPPNNFSAQAVNDQMATLGLRTPLRYFQDNVGKTIELFTGEVGDEGWHALRTIPNAWKNTGPTPNGAQNFLLAGPGLGSGKDDPEVLLDKIPDVTPLRAMGLTILVGQTVLAVVYDGDVSTNYSPLNANLMGANLGLVAFDVLGIQARTDGSSGSLPKVRIRIRALEEILVASPLMLFDNAPQPSSSSVPMDVTPTVPVPSISLKVAL